MEAIHGQCIASCCCCYSAFQGNDSHSLPPNLPPQCVIQINMSTAKIEHVDSRHCSSRRHLPYMSAPLHFPSCSLWIGISGLAQLPYNACYARHSDSGFRIVRKRPSSSPSPSHSCFLLPDLSTHNRPYPAISPFTESSPNQGSKSRKA